MTNPLSAWWARRKERYWQAFNAQFGSLPEDILHHLAKASRGFTVKELQVKLKTSRPKVVQSLHHLHRQGFVQTSSAKWDHGEVMSGKERFTITPEGRDHWRGRSTRVA